MAHSKQFEDEETGIFVDDMYLGHLASRLAKQNRNRKRRRDKSHDWSEQDAERLAPRRD